MTVKSVTPKYEADFLDIRTGRVLAGGPNGAPDGDWTFKLADGGGAAPRARVVQNTAAGVAVAFLDGTRYAEVGADRADSASWGTAEAGNAFGGAVVLLIRAGGALYKAGNAVEITGGEAVAFDYEALGGAAARPITALEMAGILKGPLGHGLDETAKGLTAGWPDYSATQIGQVLKDASVFPETTKDAMATALSGAGFDATAVEAALAALYRQTVYSYRTAGPAGTAGPTKWSDWPDAQGKGPITAIAVRHGEIVDNIQVSYGDQAMPAHGGVGGGGSVVNLDPGDVLVEISGATGPWYGSPSLLEVGFRTRSGKTYGPFGSTRYSPRPTPFSFAAQPGEELIALHGSFRSGVQAGGQQAFFMNGVGAVFQSVEDA